MRRSLKPQIGQSKDATNARQANTRYNKPQTTSNTRIFNLATNDRSDKRLNLKYSKIFTFINSSPTTCNWQTVAAVLTLAALRLLGPPAA